MEQGFNHNIEHGSVLFHIQTEDSGRGSPAIRTHLFFEGQIITSTEDSYDESSEADIVQKAMKAQHKAMIAMLIAGEFDAQIQEAGIKLQAHTWPIEVPAWLSKHPHRFYAPSNSNKATTSPMSSSCEKPSTIARSTIHPSQVLSTKSSPTSSRLHFSMRISPVAPWLPTR